ncbi:hypothetical protein JOF29_002986 [Kribbella aluminosa]|uniref:Uncharacterized protein n=1 Tax=Kribbella aluminosa TaxID=416017 RepID=A0ABS4UJR3_9ACTN|nr:hypothetical protein [Kribbella aluminosa]MBP2351903.1 hypothetical protein [Kribbella aluminosa]
MTRPSSERIELPATAGTAEPPRWAVLQRRLFDLMDRGRREFTARYTTGDGRLKFPYTLNSRDGVDDFYESFFNWPTLYLLGGADDLLDSTKHHWRGVTAQLTELGMLIDEFERGYDWFHQGESLLLFFGLCAADPDDQAFAERADRFARLYLPESPSGNYDPGRRIIRAPHTGAGGPRRGLGEGWSSYRHNSGMRHWGLPLYDLPGIAEWDDLADPVNARRMGAALQSRLGRGDTVVNLGATSLVTNAWLFTGADDLGRWVLDYTDAWRERMSAAGILPDNAGPSGLVGELHDGAWYGGHYGWTWPHGLHSVGAAALVGALNAVLVDGDRSRFDLARNPLEVTWAQAKQGVIADEPMSLRDIWAAHLGEDLDAKSVLVPNRHRPSGWFDFQPPPVPFATWLWHASAERQDAQRLTDIRAASGYDWRTVRPFRDKMESGHEEPWLEYLAGRNPDFPERMLGVALAEVDRRMLLMDQLGEPSGPEELHFWQQLNPVLTEALLQLTTGTPQVLYNGGLLAGRLRHYDPDRGRPGLPPDVAALVTRVDDQGVGLHLVNLSTSATRRVVVAAGSFGEHRITAVRTPASAVPALPRTRDHHAGIDVPAVEVVLPPRHQLVLDLTLRLRVVRPRHQSIRTVC